VRPVAVVVLFVLAQHRGGMALVGDQDAVEEFASDAANETFGERSGPRRSDRGAEDVDVGADDDRVEGGGDLGVAIPDQESEATDRVLEVDE
jgi:hypothetical protein